MFVLGAGGDFKVADTGGKRTHKLTIKEMPSHSHAVRNILMLESEDGTGVFSARDETKSMFGAPSTDTTGGNEAHENMPPYYALAYIEYVGYVD